MNMSAAYWKVLLCTFILASSCLQSIAQVDEDEIDPQVSFDDDSQPANSSSSMVMDVNIQSEIFHAFCNADSDTTTPLFCVNENEGDYLENATVANFVVVGEDGSRTQYFPPDPKVEDKCDDEGGNTSASVDLCTIDKLVVFPTTNFHTVSQYRRRNNEGTPVASKAIKKSFADALFAKAIGGTKFQVSVSLSTKSCTLRCEAGYECMPDIENINLATQGFGQCQPCVQGSFCPEGTLNDGGVLIANSKVNLCPAGFFCPNSSIAFDCPAGSFCPAGSYKPYSCDGLSISGLKLKGNYCPPNSPDPWGLCPKSYYCPTTTEAIKCPEGYYCREQSMKPVKCPPLSDCPKGSGRAQISWFALIGISCLFAGLAIALLVVALWIRCKQNRVMVKARDSAKHASLLKALGVKLGLSPNQMSYITNLTGFSENIMTVDINVKKLNVKMTGRGKSRLVLNDVTISFKAGTLNAILGSSGAGKTTLLKALVGKFSDNAHPYGEIVYNFKNQGFKVDLIKGSRPRTCALCADKLMKLKARETAVKLGVGYVAQDNIVHEILTVHENISYSAKLRLGSDMSRSVKSKIVQDTITILGLNHIQNAKVGNPLSPKGSISGGEARRVSIGLELAACPSLLILDEPTSGLDAVAANDVMSCLDKMTDLGVTVLASLHQPRYSTFLLFDSVQLFMRGGYVVYSGNASDALPYFTNLGFKLRLNENPADFMLDVISGLISLPGKEDFEPLDLMKFWEEANGDTFVTPRSRHRKTNSASPFDIDEDEVWLTKDDTLLSSRSKSKQSPAGCERDVIFSSLRNGPTIKRSASVMQTPRWLETLGEQFDRLDSHRAGYINTKHMLHLLKSMGQDCTLEDAREIVGHFDVDGDGQIKREDFLLRWTKNYWTREFSAALMKLFPSEYAGNNKVSEGIQRRLSKSSNAIQATTIEVHETPRAFSENGIVTSRSQADSTVSTQRDGMQTSREVFLLSMDGIWKFICQTMLLMKREPLKWIRMLELKVLDFAGLAILGVGYAGVNRNMVENNLDSVRQAVQVAMMFVGVLSSVWATLFMTRELPTAGREASQGISVTALFVSMNTFNACVDILIRCLAYSIMYYYVAGVRMGFDNFFLITFGVAWSTSGIGLIASCITDSRSAVVYSVAISFLFGAVLSGVTPSIATLKSQSNPFLYWMVLPSYNRWAVEALVLAEERANPAYEITGKVEEQQFGYKEENWINAIIFLYVSGFVLRLICFGCFYKRVMD